MEPLQPGGEPQCSPARANSPDTDRDLTVIDVARRLDMPIRTISRWTYTGRIPSTVAPEGTWRFRPEDLAAIAIPSDKPA